MNDQGTESVVQLFTDDYLERCRQLSPMDIVRFLDDYRVVLGAAKARSRVRLNGDETNHSKIEPVKSATGSGFRPNSVEL
ncbi:MAG: hypothetical protein OXH37_04040 [Gammaproteobacteria bacterium]|nr:hypothetical protein [Gammaproteobacteria bacterium]